jgi:hypothetical protein
MKKVFTTLSSLLVILGLKAQTPTTIKKETAPQVKPSATTIKPGIEGVKGAATAKYGMGDSMKESTIKHEGIKNAAVKDFKQSTIKEADIKLGTIKEADIKKSSIKEATIKEGTIKEATIKQAHIKK